MPKTMKLSARPLPIILVRGWGGPTVEDEREELENELGEALQQCQCAPGEHQEGTTLRLETEALCVSFPASVVAPTPCAPCGIMLKEVA